MLWLPSRRQVQRQKAGVVLLRIFGDDGVSVYLCGWTSGT